MATLATTSTYENNSSALAAYENFVNKAQFNRFGWAVTALAIQGCVLSPALLLSMFYFNGGDWQFLTGMLCFLLVIVPILAAMPVKYIFPTFGASLLIQLTIILINIL